MRRSVVGLLLIATFLTGLVVGQKTTPPGRPDLADCRVVNILPAEKPDGGNSSQPDFTTYSASIRTADGSTVLIPVSPGLAAVYASATNRTLEITPR